MTGNTRADNTPGGHTLIQRYDPAFPTRDLRLYHRNPNTGDVAAITDSLRVHGQYRAIVGNIGTHTGRPNEVLAGNHTLTGGRDLGWDTMAVEWVDVDDDQAARIVAVDNRTAELGHRDDRLLAELLAELGESDGGLAGTGYDDTDLDALRHAIEQADYDSRRASETGDGDKQTPTKRDLPLDLIFSWTPDTALAMIATQIGWGIGCISTNVRNARNLYALYPGAPRLTFMDNEWHGYDHAAHVAAVKEMRPRYATVRDLLTKPQADDAKVDWYSLDDTLGMAEDVAPHVDNVILIPKYDCVPKLPDRIGPARVVLGYSVESSYGGTPLPIQLFTGRPIHLLGGSWKKQRAYLNLMGRDVVSLDNNHLANIAQWARVTMPDGTQSDLHAMLDHRAHRGLYGAAVMSLTAIASAIMEDYGVDLPEQHIGPPEPITPGEEPPDDD